MKGISNFSIKRPVATTMIIISMVTLGLIAMANMSTALMPDFDLPYVNIRVIWTGASPDDVNNLVTKEIEDVLSNVEGVDKVTSYSEQGYSNIFIEFKYGVDLDKKVDLIQTEVNNIKGKMPSDIEEPLISKMDMGAGTVMELSFSGNDLVELTTIMDTYIKPKLERITGVGEVIVLGDLEKTVHIEVDPNLLSSYNITIDQLIGIIQSSSVNIPSGKIEEGAKELIVRVMGEIKNVEEIENIVISNSGGKILRLKDISDIKLGVKDPTSYSRTDGNPAIKMVLTKAKGGNSVFVANKTKESLEALKDILPSDVKYRIIFDSSININNSIGTVKDNALIGLLLASIILFIFLKNVRATAIVAMAIPTSIVFTFVFLKMKDISLNTISLMGLALGVGMLVDNAVVVLDNIYRHMSELNKPKMEAARDGAGEMAIPIIASTATTVAVFLPILFKPGLAREIFHDLSFSIMFALGASLIVALTFVPMMSSKYLKKDKKMEKEGKTLKWIKGHYEKILKVALKKRKTVMFLSVMAFVLAVGSGVMFMASEFLPKKDEGNYTVAGAVAKGMELDRVDEIGRIIEEIVKKDEYTKSYSLTSEVGAVVVNVDVGEKGDRDKSVFEIAKMIREKLSDVPDVNLNITTGRQRGPEGGKDIEFNILGDNQEKLVKVSKELTMMMKEVDGLVDVKNSFDGGYPEAKLFVKREKLQDYGLRVSDVSKIVSYNILGMEPISIRTEDEEVDIKVRLKEEYRNSTKELMNIRFRTPDGVMIKLGDVVELRTEEGPAGIIKEDKLQRISISANTEGVDLRNAQKRIKTMLKKYDMPKGVSYSFGGEGRDFSVVMKDLMTALVVSIFLIYFILAAQFESFTLPFIIMGSVPLSVIGVFGGLVITGKSFNIMVMVGIIMLAGIVVNNAIVLIDYVKLLIAREVPRDEAIIEAGKVRLRPILMTTATTVFGMIPLSLGIGQGSEMYQSMAIAIIFGLSLSTLLTLIVIPVMYAAEEDTREKVKSWFKKG